MKDSKTEKLLKNFIPLQKNIQTIQSQIKMTELLGYYSKDNYEANDRIETLKSSFDDALNEAIEQCTIIEKVIEQVDDINQQAVLRLRYIEGLRWHEVSERMNYCPDHCIRLKNNAVRELDNLNIL